MMYNHHHIYLRTGTGRYRYRMDTTEGSLPLGTGTVVHDL